MKILSLTLSALLAAVMGLSAQNARNASLLSYAANPSRPAAAATITDSGIKPEYINSVNIAAVRDFVKRFKEPADARWYKMTDGCLMVKFDVPAVNYRVVYTARGSWMYTLETYHEKDMPRDIRGIVKSTYYDYSISQVEQIDHVDGIATVYIVHLKDDTSWKTVRVCNGEMDVLETLYKK